MYFFIIQIVEHIHGEFGHLLTSLDLVWLDPVTFAEAIHNKGAALDNCWGFIDGTTRSISRPRNGQRVVFSGHKRTHCFKFQVRITASFFNIQIETSLRSFDIVCQFVTFH